MIKKRTTQKSYLEMMYTKCIDKESSDVSDNGKTF